MPPHSHQQDGTPGTQYMPVAWYIHNAFLASVMSGVQQLSFQESRMFTADLQFTKYQF